MLCQTFDYEIPGQEGNRKQMSQISVEEEKCVQRGEGKGGGGEADETSNSKSDLLPGLKNIQEPPPQGYTWRGKDPL